MEWSEFAAAVALFERRSASIAKHFKGAQAYENNPNFLGDIQAMGASRLVLTTSNLYRKSGDGRIIDRLLSLEALVSILSDFKARERHDTIYAMLALAKDTWRESSLGPVKEPTTAGNTGTSSESQDTRKDEQLSPRSELQNGEKHGPPPKAESSQSQGKKKSKKKKANRPAENGVSRHTSNDVGGQQVGPLVEGRTHPPPPADLDPIAALSGKEKALAQKGLAKFKTAADPKNTQRLKVNYKQDFLEVCKQFMIFAIGKSESLDLLCRPWAPEEEDRPLPSWIPTLAGIAFGVENNDNAPGGRKMTRQNADPLVGSPNLGRKIYAACKSLSARHEEDWGFRDTAGGRVMFVTGFVLDRVGKALAPAFFGNIPGQWIKLGWPDRTRPTPEPFWRTLVADRGPHGLNVPVYYQLAWDHACNPSSQKRGAWDGLVRRGIDMAERIHHGHCTIMAEFLRRVQSVIWNRKLIQTERGQYLGLGPEGTEVGDGEY